MTEERTDLDVQRDLVKTYLYALATTQLPQLPDPDHLDRILNAIESIIEIKIKENEE